MKENTKCKFCSIVNGEFHYNGVDQPFAINDNYMAIASIGAFIEGWSLIIPKKHQLSMKNCFKYQEFTDFVDTVLPTMNQNYGPLVAFEHGSNKEGSITACGTNHAHLHLVPLSTTLLPELKKSNMLWDQCLASEIVNKVDNNEYLFYTDLNLQKKWNNPSGYLHILEKPISQYFRFLIASHIGCPNLSNYREFPFLENAWKTSKRLTRISA